MSGYEKASTATTLTIKANKSTLEIEKLDKQTQKGIAHVTFEIKDEKGKKLGQVTTGANGVASLSNLYPQTVIVREVSVPEPYIVANAEKQVKLEYGKKASVTFENERKKGNLKIVKVDAENEELPLENVEFELYDNKGIIVKKLVTNKKGEAYVNNLEVGSYTLKEKKTKDGYDLAEDRKIEIKWNETSQEVVKNKKQKGQIEVYKIEKENKKQRLEGVVFEVLDANKKLVETIITNQEGYSRTSYLPIGKYYLKEIKTGNKYLLTQEIMEIEVKKDQIITCYVENEKKKGQIEVYKVDAEDKKQKLEGVIFEILDEGNNVVETIITNEEGYSRTSKLPIGNYYVKEIKTKETYRLSKELIKVEIKQDQIATVIVENQKKKGQIEISKIDAEKKEIKLENVEFQIWNDKQELVETILTNQDGYAITKELPIGEYIIKETKTNENYVLSEEITKVEVKYGEVEKLELKNEKIKGKIKIIKISENDNLRNGKLKGTPIEGVVFQIKDAEGKILETLTTNEEGIAISKELEKGSYTIKEIKNHPDYEITTEEFEVKIGEHQTIEEIRIANSSKEPEKPKLPRTGF